jgi:hypothetical protein
MAESAASKNRGRADYAFTYNKTKWKWSDVGGVWVSDNDPAASRIATMSPEPLATYKDVRGAVNRYGADTSKRTKTESQGSLTIRQVLREAGCPAGKLNVATAICIAESGGNAAAVNVNTDSFKSKDVGLSQVNLHYHPEYTETEMKEPRANARAMGKISNNWTDFRPWATYTSGKYIAFLGQDRKVTNAADSVGPGEPAGTLEQITGAAKETASDLSLGNIADGVASVVKALFDPSTYLRLGKGFIGLVLILLAVGALLKQYLKG